MSKTGRYFQQQLDYIYNNDMIEENMPTKEEYNEYCEWRKQKDIEGFDEMIQRINSLMQI